MLQVSWRKYIIGKQKGLPNKLLIQGLKYVIEKNAALDIGAGSLVDSKLLLKDGFNYVYAIDTDKTALEIAQTINDKNFIFKNTSINKFRLKKNFYDVINAQYVLPYLSKKEIEILLPKINKSLKCDGIFIGQFFGEKDSWNVKGDYRTYYTKKSIITLLKSLDFKILFFSCEQGDGFSRLGKPKYKQIFHFIVKK